MDTNIFVGACMGVGASNKVVALCISGRFEPLMGAALLTEYEDVLARQSLFEGCRLSQGERDELLDVFLARCLWTRIFFGWRPNLPDEADNHLFELAVAGSAQKIVTRNLSDLQKGELKFSQIEVLGPEQLLKEIDP
ncbi:MAG: PIN domain-containing protein [Wenzhouxiangellaceae bacterium]|nr:PIN domain-containing protein [Wenzhouxiangellaceae bacterium]